MNVNFIINNASFFLSHRLNIAEHIIDSNLAKVSLYSPQATRDEINIFNEKKINYFEIPFVREKLNLVSFLKLFFYALKIVKREKDSIFHIVTIIPILIFGLPARFLNRKCVFALSGMGTVFSSQKIKYSLLRKLILLIYAYLFNGKNSRVIVQNKDDYFIINDLMKNKKENIFLIRGSGVDPSRYTFFENYIVTTKPIILVPARLIKEKGIYEMCAASNFLNEKNIDHEVWFAGDIDPGNPLSLTSEEIEKFKLSHASLKFLGFCENMLGLYEKCTIVCLPSYREGLPKALIEAAACGRAIVTCDVPGCREIVTQFETGILVKEKCALSLSDGLAILLSNKQLMERVRKNARVNFMKYFTSDSVTAKTTEIYMRL